MLFLFKFQSLFPLLYPDLVLPTERTPLVPDPQVLFPPSLALNIPPNTLMPSATVSYFLYRGL